MNRRGLLRMIGGIGAVGLAGCTAGGQQLGGPNTDTRRVSLVSQDSVANRHQLQVSADLLTSVINDEETAQLRVTMMNTGPERTFSIGSCVEPSDCGGYIFDQSAAGSDDPAGLWLRDPAFEPDDERWVRDKPADEPRGFPQRGYSKKQFETGESVSKQYAVWDDYRTNGYLEPSTYRWEEEIWIWDGASIDPEDPDTKVTWGFSLLIEVPD